MPDSTGMEPEFWNSCRNETGILEFLQEWKYIMYCRILVKINLKKNKKIKNKNTTYAVHVDSTPLHSSDKMCVKKKRTIYGMHLGSGLGLGLG